MTDTVGTQPTADTGDGTAGGGGRPFALGLMVLLGSLTALPALSIDAYLPSLPTISDELHASPTRVQLSLTACLLGLAFGQLLLGPLSDRFGRRRPLLAGLLVYSLASGLCALAPTAEALTGLRLLQGLAGSAGVVIANAVVRDRVVGAAAARIFSLLMLVMGVAPIVAPLLGAQILRLTSWRGVFVVLAGLGLLLTLAVWRSLPETLPARDRHRAGIGAVLRVFARLVRNGRFRAYLFTQGFGSGVLFCYIAGSPFVLEDVYGFSPQEFSVAFAVNSCGLILAGLTNSRLVRRLAPSTLLRAGLAVALTGGLVLVATVSLDAPVWAVLPGFFLVIVSTGFVRPNAVALALSAQSGSTGSASALMGFFSFISGAIVAPLVGAVGTSSAEPVVLLTLALAGCAVLSGLLATRAGTRTGRVGS